MMETIRPSTSTTPSLTPPPSSSSSHPKHKIKKVESVSATECANCGTTTTPLWRRGPNGEIICNACGLYLKARNTLRPPTLKRAVHKKTTTTTSSSSAAATATTASTTNDCGSGTCPGGGQCNGTGGSTSCAGCPAFNQHQVNRQALICANCRTTTTPLWRRDEQGNTICNACGLYYKLHNVHRPVSMKRSVIKRRKRVIVTQASDEEETMEEDDDTLSQKSQTSHSKTHVPEIEDYIALKKKKIIDLPLKKQETHTISSSMTNTMIKQPSKESLSPLQQMTSPINQTSLSDKIINQHQSPSPLLFNPSPQHRSSLSPPPTQQQQQQQQQNTNFLPPISSERQSFRLESLFGRRESNSSSSSMITNTLPPLSLPPLTPPLSQPLSSFQQQPTKTSYELADFDHALDRLEHLRRQVRPEQAYALSQLTQSLTDLASKAEALLSLDSLAFGR